MTTDNHTKNSKPFSQTQTLVLNCTHREMHEFVPEIQKLAAQMEPISLAEMDSAALLNRVDTKYVLPAIHLFDILKNLTSDYRVLCVQGRCLNHYRTLYFDSPDFSLFRMHVNGKAERYKVRSREYLDTHLSFLEVKQHTRKQRTVKQRLQTPKPVFSFTEVQAHWLQHVISGSASNLQPMLWNTFTRITLVGREKQERVTLDMDLNFFAESRAARMNRLVIAEVKQNPGTSASPFIMLMRDKRLHPSSFSKYVVGVSLLYEGVKKNAAKSQLQNITKIYGGLSHGYVC